MTTNFLSNFMREPEPQTDSEFIYSIAQRRLQNIYRRGHEYTETQLDTSIRELILYTREMVSTQADEEPNIRRAATRTASRFPQILFIVLIELIVIAILWWTSQTITSVYSFIGVMSLAFTVKFVTKVLQALPQAPIQALPQAEEHEHIWLAPLTANKFEKIKTVSIAKYNQKSGTECTICFTAYKNGDMMTTDCGHIFCIDCWGEWCYVQTEERLTCPTCRKFQPVATYLKTRASNK